MSKLNMSGFEYKNGNSIKINGFFGEVEIVYFEKQNDICMGEIPSHFIAYSNHMSDACNKQSGTGETPLTAISDLYKRIAENLSLVDSGLIY